MARDAVCPTVEVSPSRFRELRVNPQSPALSNRSPPYASRPSSPHKHQRPEKLRQGVQNWGWLAKPSRPAICYTPAMYLLSRTSQAVLNTVPSEPSRQLASPPKTDVIPTESAGTANKAQKRKYG